MSDPIGKNKMEDENKEQSRGGQLWDRAKAKIRAVQSFLKIQNQQKNDILSKRKNPFSDQCNENKENLTKKQKTNENDNTTNQNKTDQDEVDQHNRSLKCKSHSQMEVLEEGDTHNQKKNTVMEVESCAKDTKENSSYTLKNQKSGEQDQEDDQKEDKDNDKKQDKDDDDEQQDKSNSQFNNAFIDSSNNTDDNQNDKKNDSFHLNNSILKEILEEQDDENNYDKDSHQITDNNYNHQYQDDDEDEKEKEQNKENEDEEEDKKDKDDEDDDDDDDYEDDDEEKDEDEEKEDEENIDNEIENKRNKEDALVKSESIYVEEAIFDEENTQEDKEHVKSQNNDISLNINEEDNVITINICNREYRIDLNKDTVKNNEKLIKIVNDITDLVEQLKVKQNVKIQELMKITDHNQFTALEYFLMKTMDDIFKEEKGIKDQKWQEEICCICQCDLFDNIDAYTQEDFLKQLSNSSDDDPINLKHCESHFFHKCCLQMMIQSTHIKCPVCSKIYGQMIGDQTPGTMKIYLDKYSTCEGYSNCSTIVIEMRMNSTKKNGQSVPSTTRVGYLPNNEEARKILEMFKRAFKRRLLYTVGKSVTTGKDNRIIWNGVHFKTNTYGGSSNFGYPDPTYFQRVTQELSLKGIYPKDISQ